MESVTAQVPRRALSGHSGSFACHTMAFSFGSVLLGWGPIEVLDDLNKEQSSESCHWMDFI